MSHPLSSKENRTFDAIVVGSGVSGGWAAKELTEKGLKTLLIERGKPLNHITGYTTAMKDSWEMPHRGRISLQTRAEFPIQSQEGNYPVDEYNEMYWQPEKAYPYIQEQPYAWFRGDIVGGKSILWGRQVYRWSDHDFTANAREGIAIDWPIRYKDIAPWYSYVEKFIGVSGEALGLSHIPDSDFQPPMDYSCVERYAKDKFKEIYGNQRVMTIGRVAHITQPTPEQTELGRAACQYRNRCSRGCPYGAFFSTQAATLPAAERTNNLTLVTRTVVRKVLFDETTQKAKGVEIVDMETGDVMEVFAKIIFLNGSTIATTQVMLNSTSRRFPNGLGNDSEQLGRNLMDHHSRAGASGTIEGFLDKTYYGRRANGIFVPRYRNIGNDKRDYLRGFDYQGGGSRSRGQKSDESFGAGLKAALTEFGSWSFSLGAFGETLPYEDNRMTLHPTDKDAYGMPLIVLDAGIKDNEEKMRVDMENDAAEMLEAIGAKNVKSFRMPNFPLGMSKHEMGTARMGHDPKTSVLNAHNQVWGCPNVFVTDGACMVSTNCVNPSLTYMALTARAVDYAVSELKKGNL